MNNEDKIIAAANEIADQFSMGFCNDRMVENFATVIRKHFEDNQINQKPLSDRQIYKNFIRSEFMSFSSFEAGVIFAEQYHGIGLDDE